MNKHIDHVRSCWIQTKHLAIKRVREPCNRMPVRCFRRPKSPNHCAPCKACANVGIVGNVRGIVIVEKWIARNWAIERNRCQCQQKAENQVSFSMGLKNAGLKNGGFRRSGVGILHLGSRRIHRSLVSVVSVTLSWQPVVPPETLHGPCGPLDARAGWPECPCEEGRANWKGFQSPTRQSPLHPNGR